MKNIVYLLTILIMVTAAATGCSSANALGNTDIQLKNAGETYPTKEFITYEVILQDKDGEAVSPETVYLYMNMERMHHPMEGKMKETEPGKFAIELPLAMEGEWYAIVTISEGENEVEKQFEIFGEGEMEPELLKGYNADEAENGD
ncbi:FixH family protein [Evansella sp. LMS18]|jgi:hypothetical protein|uniref:FixH family protein n=1 Tax=Evansella sp. LMS18 TaxID=2924033 RepID=UPI0020D125B2|nr:FixH family protein [Evansella sp. LMS18]UTR11188.1 FixH family protein [Evansella sp. LMS18]